MYPLYALDFQRCHLDGKTLTRYQFLSLKESFELGWYKRQRL
jgi:hypothetical protein